MRLDAGILAGGKSTRFGINKAFLRYNDQSFLEIIVNELTPLGNITLSIDSAGAYQNLEQVLPGYTAGRPPYSMVEDQVRDCGPIEGIRQLLLNSTSDHMFICAVDMPFIKKELALYMAEFISSNYDFYIMKDETGVHPLCGIYQKKALTSIEAFMSRGGRKVLTVLEESKTKFISLENTSFKRRIIRNINTPEDYRALARPFVFCVSGIKNSGKTTLIERLISEFKRRFPKIAVIKHDGHDSEIDVPGKDTHRYSDAGAQSVSVFCDSKYSIMKYEKAVLLDDLIAGFDDHDIIIVEGMKSCKLPKLEIVRSGISDSCVCDQSTLIAVATDTLVRGLEYGVKTVDLKDVKAIVLAVTSYFEGEYY
jgi:molybdopterin-guanine dinucleotide biosynthesis protein